jgi:potassium-transporting ATPase KdpC subunit
MTESEKDKTPAQSSFSALAVRALGMLAVLTLLTGVAYPLLVTGIAQAAFPDQANGSLLKKDGKVVGSTLLGQSFDDPKYFWGRLSATTPGPYNAASSTGSNLGPTNPELKEKARARIDALRAADPDNAAPVPVDLVTSSGSGLDPHISLAAADYQVRRVARVRAIPEDRVRAAVSAKTEHRQLGFFGEPRVNVLMLNLALDEEARRQR